MWYENNINFKIGTLACEDSQVWSKALGCKPSIRGFKSHSSLFEMILVINTSNLISDERYIDPLIPFLPKDNLVKHHLEIEEIPKNTRKIIVSGNSIFSANLSLREIRKKFNWLEDFDKPVLGICAGQQIIAQYFGARLERDDVRGLKKFSIKNGDEVLNKVKPEFDGYVSHSFSVGCPKDFRILAKNNKEYIAKHKNRKIYISSFHPEFSEKQILKNFTSERI